MGWSGNAGSTFPDGMEVGWSQIAAAPVDGLSFPRSTHVLCMRTISVAIINSLALFVFLK